MRAERTISSSRDFERLYKRGRRSRRGPMILFTAPRESPQAPSRLGLAVRVPGSVRRNRARRRLREAFRRGAPDRGLDVVIRAGTEVEEAAFADLIEAVRAGTAGIGGDS